MPAGKIIIPPTLESKLSPELISRANEKIFLLGVTGSMRCGKSYTCKRLVEIGAEINLNVHHISLDAINRYILGKSPEFYEVRVALENAFGQHLMRKDTSIDRGMLKRIILNDREANRMFYLTMFRYEMEKVNLGNFGKKGVLLLESALLVENDYMPKVDYNVLLVHCRPEVQYARIKKLKADPEELAKKVEQQLPYLEKRERITRKQEQLGRGYFYEFEANPHQRTANYLALLASIVSNIK